MLMIALPLPAQSRGRSSRRPGTGDPLENPMPWRFEESAATPDVPGGLILFWLPASDHEMEHSALQSSSKLREASDRCVTLVLVVPADTAMERKLDVYSRPAAVLTDAHSTVVRRIENATSAPAVEQMVVDELKARDEGMYRDLAAARKSAAAGEKEKAIELFRRIWDDRCLFPLAGKEAQNGLKALGVVVEEPVVGITMPPKM
jgi:hypothetical protein